MEKSIGGRTELIVAILIFYFSMDVAVFATKALYLQPLLYIIQFSVFLMLVKKPVIYRGNVGIMVILIVSTAIVGLVHGFDSLTYPYKIFLYLLCYQIVTKLDFGIFQKSFCKVAYFLSIYSVGFYILQNLVGTIGPSFSFMSSEEGRQYATNLIYTYLTENSFRNCGVYHEPGVFQIYLNIALLFYYNIHKEIVIDKVVFVYVFAILTTVSAAGIAITALIVLLQYMLLSKKSLSSTILMMVVFSIGLLGISIFFDQIFSKISDSPTERAGSFFARYYSLFIPMRIFWDHPAFGCGASNFTDILDLYETDSGLTLSAGLVTNTITVNFATSGLIIGFLYTIGFYKGIERICFNFKQKFFFVAFSFLLISSENITYTLLFNYLLILGLCGSTKAFEGNYNKLS